MNPRLTSVAVAGVILAVAALSTTARAQTEKVSLWDNGFRYQVMQIIPWGNASRTNTTMGSGTINYPTEAWTTGFGPCTIDNHQFLGNSDESWACTQHWWWYRGTGDTREYSVSNQASFVQNGLNQATIVYSEPVAGVPNALRFTFIYTLTGAVAGPNTAIVNVALTIENTSAANQDVSLFNYAELNAGGLSSPSDDVWSYSSFPHRSQFLVHNSPTSDSPRLTFGTRGVPSVQNTRWAAGNSVPSFARSRWINTTAEDLPLLNSQSTPMTTTAANYSGFMQFQRTLAPGESASSTVYIGYNYVLPDTCTADVNADGDAGTDADIEAFFACLGGNCCAACASGDFNGDGDTGTDADIESFFRVLGGGEC